jgi:hypothetical protein
MSYRVGGVVVQGNEPSNITHVVFRRKTNDGGKAGLPRRRVALSCSTDALDLVASDAFRFRDVPTVDHADPEDTRPSELA